jgi:AraC family transcriptional regulator, positive regulator of tynA and feaB
VALGSHLLTRYVAQLSPEFVAQAPLPQSMLLDQVGALLALTATELRGGRAAWTPVERSVRDEVHIISSNAALKLP